MSLEPNGELVPIGGGDPIPLERAIMKIGRRESCDICLRFPNISGEHSQLNFIEGYWQISDLGSTNGTKVNGSRVQRKVLRTGDEVTIANRRFTIEYQIPAEANRAALEDSGEDIMTSSLLERAGLVHRRDDEETPRPGKNVRPRKP